MSSTEPCASPPAAPSGDVDHATHAYGLAVPFGIVSTTGVAGLTLGGGIGYLSRQHGLTIDNLLEADVVLADGRLVTASPTSHADLFWGLRGGGGNFGVVTSFLFQAHPVSQVFAGPVFWGFEHTEQVMRAYREFLAEAPEELGSFVGIKKVPAVDPFPAEHHGELACAVISCYNGPADRGAEVMTRLLDQLPEPMFNWMDEMPFPAMQGLFDPLLPPGLQWYWRGEYVHELTDAAIEEHIAQSSDMVGALTMVHLYPIDGAVHRVGPTETAWNERSATWTMVIVAVDEDPALADDLSAWAKRYWSAIHKHTNSGGYVNFMMDDGDHARLAATYGENFERLRRAEEQVRPDQLLPRQPEHPDREHPMRATRMVIAAALVARSRPGLRLPHAIGDAGDDRRGGRADGGGTGRHAAGGVRERAGLGQHDRPGRRAVRDRPQRRQRAARRPEDRRHQHVRRRPATAGAGCRRGDGRRVHRAHRLRARHAGRRGHRRRRTHRRCDRRHLPSRPRRPLQGDRRHR